MAKNGYLASHCSLKEWAQSQYIYFFNLTKLNILEYKRHLATDKLTRYPEIPIKCMMQVLNPCSTTRGDHLKNYMLISWGCHTSSTASQQSGSNADPMGCMFGLSGSNTHPRVQLCTLATKIAKVKILMMVAKY